MKLTKKVLSAILAILVISSLFSGCSKEIYRGPFDYPENMPKASNSVSKARKPLRGYIQASVVDLTLINLLSIYSERLDSFYRVTIDRELSSREATTLNGYERTGGGDTYFEATVWYDYMREEKMEKKIVLRQGGTKEYPYEDERFYEKGESYILLLSHQFADWDFTDTFGNLWSFTVINSEDTEIAILFSEGLPEFDSCQLSRKGVDQSEYSTYSIEALIQEFKSIFSELISENDMYHFPTLDEYLYEYNTNRHHFMKDQFFTDSENNETLIEQEQD